MSSMYHWWISSLDVQFAILKTGPTQHGVHVISRRESKEKGSHVLLFIKVAFDLLNASAKLHFLFDHIVSGIGFPPVYNIPQNHQL